MSPMQPLPLRLGLEHGVFWITRRIAQGSFLTPKRGEYLQSQQITHVLNVGEARSIVSVPRYGLAEIRDVPVADLERIPDRLAIEAIDALHSMLAVPESRVFVHCVAGQNRSPTIVWLYLIACGISPSAARALIAQRTADAVPGHQRLVDERLIARVVSHGAQKFLPLIDPSVLEPAY